VPEYRQARYFTRSQRRLLNLIAAVGPRLHSPDANSIPTKDFSPVVIIDDRVVLSQHALDGADKYAACRPSAPTIVMQRHREP
jgi:hypothetical protein